MPDASARPTIICPLSLERRLLRRASSLVALAEIVCCGPGPAGVQRWAHRSAPPRGGLVILAGLAGGLAPSQSPGSVWVVRRVLEDGTSAPPPPERAPWPDQSHSPAVSIVSVDRPVCEPAAKRQLHERSGAELVDMESAAFARVAVAAGWRWGIVRGVSDDVGTRLPASIGRWVGETGRPRPAAIAAALTRQPPLASVLLRLRRDSREAMRGVGSVLQELLVGR